MSSVRFLRIDKMNRAGFEELLSPYRDHYKNTGNEFTAVKIHPGEEGNSSYIPASLVKEVVSALDLPKRNTFLTDTTVLYGGKRMTAPDYVLLAHEHGFRMPDLPPFIVADGLTGTDEFTVELPPHCTTGSARLAAILAKTDRAVVISHFKGHLLAGFGGSIKHLGMGWAAKAGKLYQHSSVTPRVKSERCTLCGACLSACGVKAISVSDAAMHIDENICTGCGECIQRCPTGAIRIKWNQESHTFFTRMTEYALAASMAVSIPVYVNFLINISPDCDCMKNERPPLVEDIGVLASDDPVSLDQACLDLVTAAAPAGQDKFLGIRPDRDGCEQLRLGEELGLGSRHYELVTL